MLRTKEKLINGLKNLMETTAVDSITVNQLTLQAEVSRNTFYYHFEDVHDLLRTIYTHEIVTQLEHYRHEQDWYQGLKVLIQYIADNKKFCLNTFHSVNRDLLSKFLYKLSFEMITGVVDDINPNCSNQLRDEIGNFYGWALTAQIIQWLTIRLEEDQVEFAKRMYTMLHTTIQHIIEVNTANSAQE